ncbi:acetyl-CoA synthetase-like protein [Phellopilus nigrolimitatus]|nr:acetyl-CoA synthetase-like protein [Phellopilus nigrolimitatus]
MAKLGFIRRLRGSRTARGCLSQPNLQFCRRNLLTSSYVEGSNHPPLNPRTLTEFFETELLSKLPSKPALVCRKERPRAHAGPQQHNLGRSDCLAWSFEEFNRHIEALARGLLLLGVKKGDRVGVVMGNNSAYASLQWACAGIGAVLVTINPAYRVHELINTLKLVDVSTLVLVPRIRSSNYLNSLTESIPDLTSSKPGSISVEELPALRNILVVDNTSGSDEYQKLLDGIRCAIDFREAFVWSENSNEHKTMMNTQKTLMNEDIINLQFTSGTTGAPKAVSATYHHFSTALMSPLSFLCTFHYLGMLTQLRSILLDFRPISFLSLRLILGNLAAWTHGSCVVYPSELFHPPSIVDAVVHEQCTALHGVPTHFLGVLTEMEKRKASGEVADIHRLRTGIAAGSPVPIELMQRLISELNLAELTNAYGMTETSPVSFQSTPDDPVIKRTQTVGKVQPHVKAKLIDSDGKVVPVGTPGEICVSGYLVQKGYWQDDKQTKSVMRRHPDDPETLWMHTGDIGILDEEGYLQVVGRSKDVIIRGGENLFPVQIENRLTFHPAIREAAVVAVPDIKYGEAIGTWIVRERGTRLSRDEVRKWVAEGMNPQNAPTWVWFMNEEGTPSELPKTASGKVQKHILRDWSKDLVARNLGFVIPI